MSEEPLFGKFRITECFKKDDSLAVYLADHIYLNKKIILKTLNTVTISDNVVLERFKREAQLLAKINHPNIISVYDFGTFEEFFYISFEYFEGQNLRQAFSTNKWTNEDKVNILSQIATGLSETHHKKIIHRDLKPENILINEKNEVKIADFGLAQVSGAEKLTAAEAIVGTPAYMTPEQIQGFNPDERSDLFSLGILVYEMFFGVNPFLGKDAGQTLNNIQTCRINTPPSHSGMPQYIPVIIDSLLKKNPSDRPESVDFIFQFTGGASQKDTPIKRSSIKYIVSIIIIAGIITSVYILRNNPGKQENGSTDTLVAQDTSFKEIKTLDTSFTMIKAAEMDSLKAKPKVIQDFKPVVEKTQVKDTSEITTLPKTEGYGFISIKCKPWANVLIDSVFIDTTPLQGPYKILAGEHKLVLQHPEYPVFSSIVKVTENDTFNIFVNLNNFVGYLMCNIFPWGDIYINDEFKGQTPLNRPIILEPGKHVLEIKNPGYEIEKSEINIVIADTLKMTIKLKKSMHTN
jgi:eukaryotic-like serine/threonine-protein kinase